MSGCVLVGLGPFDTLQRYKFMLSGWTPLRLFDSRTDESARVRGGPWDGYRTPPFSEHVDPPPTRPWVGTSLLRPPSDVSAGEEEAHRARASPIANAECRSSFRLGGGRRCPGCNS